MDTIFLLLLSLLVLSSSISPSLATNSEGEILLSFKASMKDPAGVLQSWDADLVDPCTWLHITCNSDNRVVRIDLGNAGLSGHLIPELGSISFLQYLELFKNNLSGSIPRELGKLKSLIALDLYDNNLSGHIPQQLDGLSSLTFLRLSGNKLTGAIPFSLTTISTLDVLELANNELRGVIPTNGSFVKFNASSFYGNPGLCGNVSGKPCTH